MHAVEDGQRGANRALGVVLVRLRDPEGGHHGVAGELLDDPAVRGHAVRDALEVRLDTAAHDLRIGARDERRRVDEIDEQDRCKLAFHALKCRTRSEGSASFRRLRLIGIRSVLDPKVFKAYDVRGIYGSELDEEGAHAIGRAFVEVFGPKRIAVGHDMRVSSPSMAAAAIAGAAEAGADVLELGLVGTEMVYFAVGELGLDGGIRSPPRTTRRSTRA